MASASALDASALACGRPRLCVDANAGERLAQVGPGGGHLLREGVAGPRAWASTTARVTPSPVELEALVPTLLFWLVRSCPRIASRMAPPPVAFKPLEDLEGVGLRLDQLEVVGGLRRRAPWGAGMAAALPRLRKLRRKPCPPTTPGHPKAPSPSRCPAGGLGGGAHRRPRSCWRGTTRPPAGSLPRATEPRRARCDEQPLAVPGGDRDAAVERLHVPLPQRAVALDGEGHGSTVCRSTQEPSSKRHTTCASAQPIIASSSARSAWAPGGQRRGQSAASRRAPSQRRRSRRLRRSRAGARRGRSAAAAGRQADVGVATQEVGEARYGGRCPGRARRASPAGPPRRRGERLLLRGVAGARPSPAWARPRQTRICAA